MDWRLFFTIMLGIGCVLEVSSVGKNREPVTSGGAAVVVTINLLLISAMYAFPGHWS